MDNGHRVVVKMALNAPRVAKIIYYNVSAKYERICSPRIWLKSIEQPQVLSIVDKHNWNRVLKAIQGN